MNDRSKKSGVRFDGTMDLRKVIDQLDKILDGLKAGTLHLERGNDDLTLKPGKGPAYLGVEAKQGTDKESLTVKLKWRRASAMPAQEPEPLKISSKEPPAPKSQPAAEKKPESEKKSTAKKKPAASAKKTSKRTTKKTVKKTAVTGG